MKTFRMLLVAVFAVMCVCFIPSLTAKAAEFDAAYYYAKYPDVAEVLGNDPGVLFEHYATFGYLEGRFPNAESELTGTSPAPETLTPDLPYPTYVDVDIEKQTVIYYENGIPLLSSPCVTGTLSGGRATPKGTYQITKKVPGKYLVGPTWKNWVDRWMPFNDHIGLHDASWRSEFGGEIYKKKGSHGCVNLPKDMAYNLYDRVSVGTIVLVH